MVQNKLKNFSSQLSKINIKKYLHKELTKMGTILAILIIILTLYGISITQEALEVGKDSLRIANDSLEFDKEISKEKSDLRIDYGIEEIDGRSLNSLCAKQNCETEDYDEISDSKDYYLLYFSLANWGERINNVYVDYHCVNIDYIGILERTNIDIKYVSDMSTELYFPLIDKINYEYWSTIFQLNNEIDEFKCVFNIIADEFGEGKVRIVEVKLNN